MSAFARKKGLSFKSLARIAFSDLFARPARLILTALLSVVALTLAGVAVSLAMYDEADAKADAYARTDGAILLLPAEEKIGREGSGAMALPYGAVAKAGDLLASLEDMAETQNIAADAALWGALEDYRAQNGVHVLTFLQSVAYFSEGAQRAEFNQCRIIGRAQVEPVGEFIHNFVVLNLADKIHPGMALPVGKNGVHVLLDGGGIEGFTVGEAHIAAQMERVYPAVVGDVPAFGKAWPDSLRCVADQRFKDHGLRGHFPRIQVRVDVAYIFCCGVAQFPRGVRVGGRRVVAAGGESKQREKKRQRGENVSCHGRGSPSADAGNVGRLLSRASEELRVRQ